MILMANPSDMPGAAKAPILESRDSQVEHELRVLAQEANYLVGVFLDLGYALPDALYLTDITLGRFDAQEDE